MKRFIVIKIALVSALGMACHLPSDVEVADVIGSWVAQEARFSNIANLNETVDITDLGWEFFVDIAADGGFVRVAIEPGEAPDTLTGTLTIENGKDLSVSTAAGTAATGEIFKEDEQIAMSFEEGVERDVEGEGVVVPVRLLLVMVRVSGG